MQQRLGRYCPELIPTNEPPEYSVVMTKYLNLQSKSLLTEAVGGMVP